MSDEQCEAKKLCVKMETKVMGYDFGHFLNLMAKACSDSGNQARYVVSPGQSFAVD